MGSLMQETVVNRSLLSAVKFVQTVVHTNEGIKVEIVIDIVGHVAFAACINSSYLSMRNVANE